VIDTVERVGAACAKSIAGGGKVMFCGNGAVPATASIWLRSWSELMFNRPGMSGLALTVDTSADRHRQRLSAMKYLLPPGRGIGRSGDVLVGISTFGRLEECGESNGGGQGGRQVTVAMTGAKRGPIADLAAMDPPFPTPETQKIQEGHNRAGHFSARCRGTYLRRPQTADRAGQSRRRTASHARQTRIK